MTEIASNRFAGFANCPVEAPCELSAFAWPGGYEIFYWDNNGETLCRQCAQKLVDSNIDACVVNGVGGWFETTTFRVVDHDPRLVGFSHVGEQDSCEICDDCGRVIEVCGRDEETVSHSEWCNLRDSA